MKKYYKAIIYNSKKKKERFEVAVIAKSNKDALSTINSGLFLSSFFIEGKIEECKYSQYKKIIKSL